MKNKTGFQLPNRLGEKYKLSLLEYAQSPEKYHPVDGFRRLRPQPSRLDFLKRWAVVLVAFESEGPETTVIKRFFFKQSADLFAIYAESLPAMTWKQLYKVIK